jgi:hypothetical protein
LPEAEAFADLLHLLMARVDDLRHASELELAWIEIWSASSESSPSGLTLRPDGEDSLLALQISIHASSSSEA